MTFNTQVCTTREQSERLLALGVKKETADCFIWECDGKEYTSLYSSESAMDERKGDIPAWSLHRLITMLPIRCNKDYYFQICGSDIHYRILYNTEYGISHYSFDKEESLYDNLVDCIEWLIKEGYFNKQYLNENL